MLICNDRYKQGSTSTQMAFNILVQLLFVYSQIKNEFDYRFLQAAKNVTGIYANLWSKSVNNEKTYCGLQKVILFFKFRFLFLHEQDNISINKYKQWKWKVDIYTSRVKKMGCVETYFAHLPTEIFAYIHNAYCPKAMSQPLSLRQTQRRTNTFHTHLQTKCKSQKTVHCN